eukprot:COSAG01_NODE_3988_length_5458_cov_55.445792_3_plen_55_part_00
MTSCQRVHARCLLLYSCIYLAATSTERMRASDVFSTDPKTPFGKMLSLAFSGER